jgi:pimeloyl-ACP methyl ester carboxylesterase
MNYDDFAGAGGGTVNPNFPPALSAGDRSDAEGSPRWTMLSFYYKPPFKPAREEDLLSSMLDTHVGEQDYPGDMTASANWPNVAPGKWGLINAISGKYLKAIDNLYTINPKPSVLWIRGSDDQIVADGSFFDMAMLGKIGLVPGYPGDDVAPPQAMVSQTRAVLQKYADAGGSFEEVVIADTGHTPYIEKPDAFNAAFHKFIS